MTPSFWVLGKLVVSRMADREAEASAYRMSMHSAMDNSGNSSSRKMSIDAGNSHSNMSRSSWIFERLASIRRSEV